MARPPITLALCVLPALLGCGKPEASRVRLAGKAHDAGDCHLTLNGVHIPDEVLVAKGKERLGDYKAASVGNDELRCQGAIVMMQKAGAKTDEFPSINLRS